MEKTDYNNVSSKIKRLYIGLPNFSFFHKPSDINDVDSRFVGRKRIVEVLKGYLDDSNGNDAGSYLITGYRGMGKSSFVGKVVRDIIHEKKKEKKEIIFDIFIKFAYVFFPYFLLTIALLAYNHLNQLIIISLFVLSLLVLLYFAKCKYLQKLEKKFIHYINLNLGSEVSNEREVLALIAHSIKTKFTNYLQVNYSTNNRVVFTRTFNNIIIAIFAFWTYINSYYILDIIGSNILSSFPPETTFTKLLNTINSNILIELRIAPVAGIVLGILISVIISIFICSFFRHFLFNILLKYTGRTQGFGLRSKDILKKLNLLCDRIDSSLNEDVDPYGSVNTSVFGITIKRKTSKIYNKASIREIEKELIDIIGEISNSWILNSRFIIVLDELDKINPNIEEQVNKKNDSEYGLPEFSYNENGFLEINSSYKKKRKVLYLLGQLKYFVNTAKAKFVFISGHELYDAYLADVSDREFSVSSIFNAVINVDSFFSCDSQTKDITRMTETYLCKQLVIPNKGEMEKKEEEFFSLKSYYDQINLINEKEKEKIIIFLRQFISYLTFLSNGAPKKLTTHFEKYIITKNELTNQKNKYSKEESLIVGNENYKYWLSFGYYDQQHIGFIHYIANPIFQTIISPASEYGDKLLISSSFLIAHIYKHHNSGFSWRNLEYLPELIESNRTPELREYINSLIGYLGQMHLTQITSGLYHYKFPMRLVEEISVFTKKSEEISAIFNFSLDDSRAVKQYYLDLLNFHSNNKNSSPIVVANLHHYLGDLHLANEEYTEAIGQFRTAAEMVGGNIKQKNEINSSDISSLIIRYVRSMLKLGLAYEKRNTMDSAYLVYNDLVSVLIRHRYIDESSLQLEYKLQKISAHDEDFWKDKKILLYRNKGGKSTSSFDKKIHPLIFSSKDDKFIDYWIYGEEIVDNLTDYLTPLKSSLISKLSIYEDLRLAYLPILAKLFTVEKQHVSGITKDNIKIAESEFRNLFLITNSNDKYLLSVDFFRKLGDILFYKNGNPGVNKMTIDTLLGIGGYNIKSDIFDFCYQNGVKKDQAEKIINTITKNEIKYDDIKDVDQDNIFEFIVQICGLSDHSLNNKFEAIFLEHSENIKKRSETIKMCCERIEDRKNENNKTYPCLSCKYYNRSLIIIGNKIIPNFKNEKVKNTKAALFLSNINNNKLNTVRSNDLTQTALTLDGLGNIMLSCASQDDCLSDEFIKKVINIKVDKFESEYFDDAISMTLLEKAFLYYWAASEYHAKASNNKKSVLCTVKILNVISANIRNHDYSKRKNISWITNINELNSLLLKLEELFVKPAIRSTYSNRDFYTTIEIREIKNILKKENINIGFLSILPDVEELLYAYFEIKIRLSRIPGGFMLSDHELRSFYQNRFTNYLRVESLSYNRVMCLLFKSRLNALLIEKLLNTQFVEIVNLEKEAFTKIFKNFGNDKEHIVSIDKILSDNLNEYHTFMGLDILEFLISDSIFCLSNITNFLSPTIRTTLFTNSFCASIYRNLLNWHQIYTKLTHYYKHPEKKQESDFKRRLSSFSNLIENSIESHLKNMLTTTYLREMAIKFYTKSIEMHSEGQAYQNFIDGFYLLDDDLQNNTCQFYLAFERYKINIGDISIEKRYLEKGTKIYITNKDAKDILYSTTYNPANYFQDKI